jgi:hypothetical protein
MHKSIPLFLHICQMLANRPMAGLVEVLGIGGGEERRKWSSLDPMLL